MTVYFENEDQVKEIIEYVYTERDGVIDIDQTIELFKEAGFIKLAPVEAAEVLYRAFAGKSWDIDPEIFKLITTQQTAIIQLKNEIKALQKSLVTARLY